MKFKAGKFTAYNSPDITITKWFDDTNKVCFYDLYLNGEYEARYYTFEGLFIRLSLMIQVLGGSNL